MRRAAWSLVAGLVLHVCGLEAPAVAAFVAPRAAAATGLGAGIPVAWSRTFSTLFPAPEFRARFAGTLRTLGIDLPSLSPDSPLLAPALDGLRSRRVTPESFSASPDAAGLFLAAFTDGVAALRREAATQVAKALSEESPVEELPAIVGRLQDIREYGVFLREEQRSALEGARQAACRRYWESTGKRLVGRVGELASALAGSRDGGAPLDAVSSAVGDGAAGAGPWRPSLSPASPDIRKGTIRGKNVDLIYVSYDNPRQVEGPVAVLFHGLTSCSYVWKEFGKHLIDNRFKRVYMVNFRGSGSGNHFSRVVDYSPGDYGFMHLVGDDFAAALDFVHRREGRKVVVVGHSMGAMVSLLALSGVHLDGSGATVLDRGYGQALQAMVDKLILFGPPQYLRQHVPALIKYGLAAGIGKLIEPSVLRKIFGKPSVFIPLLTSTRSPMEQSDDGRLELLRKSFLKTLQKALTPLLWANGIMDASVMTLTEEQLAKLLDHGLSAYVHSDLLYDFRNFVTRGFVSRDGFNLQRAAEARNIIVPTLAILGEDDLLATPEGFFRAAAHYFPEDNRPVSIIARGAAHIEIVLDRYAREHIFPRVLRFVGAPDLLGAPGTALEVKDDGARKGFLDRLYARLSLR